jgi:hypothetical protein
MDEERARNECDRTIFASVVVVLVAATLFGILALLWFLDWLFPLTLGPWKL